MKNEPQIPHSQALALERFACITQNLILSTCLLLVATGCANLKPDAASRQSEALQPTAFQLSDESAACLFLLGETAHCVGGFLDPAYSR